VAEALHRAPKRTVSRFAGVSAAVVLDRSRHSDPEDIHEATSMHAFKSSTESLLSVKIQVAMVIVCMITIFEKSKRLKTLDDNREKRSNTTNQLIGKSESSPIRVARSR